VAPQDALARIPDALKFEEAGPLMCAGTTTFNALRHSGARPGDITSSPLQLGLAAAMRGIPLNRFLTG
jgi:hypothetical protein